MTDHARLVLDQLVGLVLDEIVGDPARLAQLGDALAKRDDAHPAPAVPAYTVATLAVELGRSDRAIRDAIHRGELRAVKRGRGYVIGAEAVAHWATPPSTPGATRPRRPGLSRQALRRAMGDGA